MFTSHPTTSRALHTQLCIATVCSCVHVPSGYKQSSSYTASCALCIIATVCHPPRPALFCHEQSFLIDTHLLSTRSHLSPPTCLRRSCVALMCSTLCPPCSLFLSSTKLARTRATQQAGSRATLQRCRPIWIQQLFRQQKTSNHIARQEEEHYIPIANSTPINTVLQLP